MTRWRVVQPASRIEGSAAVPGDKSISHRALLVAAIGSGSGRMTGLSPAEDVRSTASVVRQLGATLTLEFPGPSPSGFDSLLDPKALKGWSTTRDLQILVESTGRARWIAPSAALDVGNSGTTIRCMLGALAPGSVRAILTGDASIRRRPMRRVVEPLRQMGASIESPDGGEHAPLTMEGRPLRGVDHQLLVASAQVKTALLLAGLAAQGTTSIVEPAPSRDHTERMLKYLGAPIDISINRCVVEGTDLHVRDIEVPGDLSSAAFFLVAAAILPGSEVTVTGVGLNPTRTGILDILRSFGATVEITLDDERCGEPRGRVTVRANDRRPFDVGGELVVAAIDELPLVAVLGAYAEGGVTTLRDAAELRIKESDRIATIVDGLRRMGAGIEPLPDGFAVRGGTLTGAEVDPAGDHRIAMALAVAALGAEGETSLAGWDCVAVSYPGFSEDLEHLVVR